MAAFRILNQKPVYFDLQGRPASGGYLLFYITGTTTPKSVFGNKALSINNGNRVNINSDGRTAVDIWGDGAYRVRVYDANNTLLSEADDVEVAGGTGASIPTLVAGSFLTNNGALLLWAPIRQLPDPTGQDGKVPTASGAGYVLQTPAVPPAPVAPNIEVTTTSLRVAQGATSFLIQFGSGSAAASGNKTTTASIVFPTPYAAAPKVFANNSAGFVTQAGDVQPTISVSSVTTTGATVKFSTQTGESNSNNNIVTPVAFDWIAFGTIATPP